MDHTHALTPDSSSSNCAPLLLASASPSSRRRTDSKQSQLVELPRSCFFNDRVSTPQSLDSLPELEEGVREPNGCKPTTSPITVGSFSSVPFELGITYEHARQLDAIVADLRELHRDMKKLESEVRSAAKSTSLHGTTATQCYHS
eukprot:TRINITY_DN112463_c0_g1_i1.p1 TRINITY_DN112463_c0_g1~~TRINITY_DN112463_c0_g1_i1.p1  ORF type:complete len:145 (-),score=10.76 TRINITY_DN112463_c0_g1_i1:156-590(-)